MLLIRACISKLKPPGYVWVNTLEMAFCLDFSNDATLTPIANVKNWHGKTANMPPEGFEIRHALRKACRSVVKLSIGNDNDVDRQVKKWTTNLVV